MEKNKTVIGYPVEEFFREDDWDKESLIQFLCQEYMKVSPKALRKKSMNEIEKMVQRTISNQIKSECETTQDNSTLPLAA